LSSKRKRPSQADYLDELEATPTPARKARAKRPASTPATPTPSSSKRKITLYFREALLEEARSAVLALGAEGIEPSNLSALFDAALTRELERLRKRHNAGEPWPRYKARLPGGRPRGKR